MRRKRHPERVVETIDRSDNTVKLRWASGKGTGWVRLEELVVREAVALAEPLTDLARLAPPQRALLDDDAALDEPDGLGALAGDDESVSPDPAFARAGSARSVSRKDSDDEDESSEPHSGGSDSDY